MRTPSTSTRTLPSSSSNGSSSASSGRAHALHRHTDRRPRARPSRRPGTSRPPPPSAPAGRGSRTCRRRRVRCAWARRWRHQVGPGSRRSSSPALRMNPGSGTQWCVHFRRSPGRSPSVRAGRRSSVESLAIGPLGALPRADGRRERALQHRRVHVLALPRDLARDERGVDRDRCVVEGGETDPGMPLNNGPEPRRADHAALGSLVPGKHLLAATAGRWSCRPAALSNC